MIIHNKHEDPSQRVTPRVPSFGKPPSQYELCFLLKNFSFSNKKNKVIVLAP
jgi:hypothetical protein